MKLGEKILNLRKKKGLSQEQLGEMVDVTRQTVSNWELGETSPNPEQLKKLSKIFQISIDELLDNPVTNILEEKVSNTEKLAGIIIKILKIFGVVFLILLVIDMIAFVLYFTVDSKITVESVQSIELKCSINHDDYLIEVGTDGYFNCSNCPKNMQEELKDNVIDFGNLNQTEKNIIDYFEKNHGSCE